MQTTKIAKTTAISVLAVATMLCAHGATAQTKVPAPADSSAQDDQTSPDIVVTARLRDERAIDVPVAVSVLTGDEISRYNSSSIQRITENIPGLVVGSTVGLGGGSISIRGVSTAPTTVGFEQPVSIVADGVPINSSWITSAGFFDLGRAEVLKGPQTLLFGKNNTAGVISLTSADPTDTFTGYIKGSYEFVADESTIDGMISGPITGTLKGRIAVRYRNMVGWMHNTAQAIANPFNPAFPFAAPPESRERLGDREFLGRISLQWDPASNFKSMLKVTVDSSRNDGPGTTSQIVGGCTGPHPQVYNVVDPYGECVPDNRVSQGQLPPGLAKYIPDSQGGIDRGSFEAVMVSFANTLSLNKVKISAITGYTAWTNFAYGNFDETSYSQLQTYTNMTYRIFSQEVRALTDFGGPINFMAGGFYQDFDVDPYHQYAKLRDDTDLNLAAGTLVAFEKLGYQHNKTFSAFAQVILKPISQLEIAGGARYTKETKDSYLANIAQYGRASFPYGKSFTDHQKFDNLSPELTIAYHPGANSTIFAGYRTGYKSGGFALSSTITAASVLGDFDFESEKVSGFEAGAKTSMLNGRLRADLTAYTYKFSNLQVNTYNPATISYTLANAGELKQVGIDASVYFDVTRAFKLHGSLNWNRNRFGTFIGQCASGQTVAEGCVAAAQSYTGRAPTRSPDWAGNAGAVYDTKIAGMNFSLTGDAIYTSSYYGAETLALGSFQPAFWRFNASARLVTANGVNIGLVGRNLSNRYYILSAQDKTGQAREQRGVVGRGREIAIEAGFKF